MNFISQAHAQAAAQQPPAEAGMIQLAMLVGLFILFYFIAIRPQRKRQKEHQELVSSITKGDEVVTTSGILGKVVKVEGDYVVLNVSNNVDLKFQRVSVHAVLPKGTLKNI